MDPVRLIPSIIILLNGGESSLLVHGFVFKESLPCDPLNTSRLCTEIFLERAS